MRTRIMALMHLRQQLLDNPPNLAGLPWWAQDEVMKEYRRKLDHVNDNIARLMACLLTSEVESIELSLQSCGSM